MTYLRNGNFPSRSCWEASRWYFPFISTSKSITCLSVCVGQVLDRRGYGLNTVLDLFWSVVDAIGFL